MLSEKQVSLDGESVSRCTSVGEGCPLQTSLIRPLQETLWNHAEGSGSVCVAEAVSLIFETDLPMLTISPKSVPQICAGHLFELIHTGSMRIGSVHVAKHSPKDHTVGTQIETPKFQIPGTSGDVSVTRSESEASRGLQKTTHGADPETPLLLSLHTVIA